MINPYTIPTSTNGVNTMAKAKNQRETLENVKVKVWEWSHNTTNGLGVYRFTVETATGEIISGKTKPNAGFRQSVGSSPEVLSHCVIETTPSGRIQMSDAAK